MEENPFVQARQKHNRNGFQTAKEVASQTGITKSLIDDLEAGSSRGVSYKTIAILAKHYDVSADYLLGLSSDPGNDQNIKSASKLMNLSQAAICSLKMLGERYPRKTTDHLLCSTLELDDILHFISKMIDSVSALRSVLDDAAASPQAIRDATDRTRHDRFELIDSFTELIDRSLGFNGLLPIAQRRYDESAYKGLFDQQKRK